MGACRILIQVSFKPQERPPATRAFLIMILLGSALAPIVGGLLVAHATWRALFACTAPAGIAFAILALLTLPDS
ncbi:MFS transporter, partial [Escherichia coli]|nr:MFS transporter [Escherichia coli]